MQTGSASAGTGEDPVALVLNIEPNVPVTVSLTSPACTQAPAPVKDGTATYSGTITTVPGGELGGGQLYVGYFRAFLQ